MRNRISRFIKNLNATHAGTFFAGFGIGVVFLGFFQTIEKPTWNIFISEVYSNFGIELVSIGLTVVVIERLNRRAAKQERLEELTVQMGSPDNSFTVQAVRLLRHRGYLEDGSLRNVFLREANLQGVNLKDANLEAAILRDAKLQGANLHNAKLQKASLFDAYLQGANLAFANLAGADLAYAKYDTNTTLPDRSKWKPGTDMDRFTDPKHPDFWRYDYVLGRK